MLTDNSKRKIPWDVEEDLFLERSRQRRPSTESTELRTQISQRNIPGPASLAVTEDLLNLVDHLQFKRIRDSWFIMIQTDWNGKDGYLSVCFGRKAHEPRHSWLKPWALDTEILEVAVLMRLDFRLLAVSLANYLELRHAVRDHGRRAENVALIQFDASWGADGLEICEVTGFNVFPTSTCADFSIGQSLKRLNVLQHASKAKPTCRCNLQLQALKGETESAQLLLRLPSTLTKPTVGATLTFQGFHGLPPGVRCELLQVSYVFTNSSGRVLGSGGGWRSDPLRPLAPNQSIGVPSNLAQPLLLTCFVSTEALPGHHQAELQMSLEPGDPSECVGVWFDIWNASIPSLEQRQIGASWHGKWEANNFEAYYGPGYWDWELNRRKWFDLMLAHRTPPDMAHPRPLEDLAYLVAQGTKWLGILNVGSYASKQVAGCPSYTDLDIHQILEDIQPLVKGIQEKGLETPGHNFYVYGFDEVPSNCEPALRQVFGAVKHEFPKLKTMAALNWKKMTADLPLDVWVEQYQLFNANRSKEWIGAGKEHWLYHCIEPNGLEYLNTFVERPTVQGRLLFWLAALWEIQYEQPSGWLYYEMNLWKPCNSPKCGGAVHKHPVVWLKEGQLENTAFTDWPEANFIWQGQFDTIFANGDGQFIYPCPDGPCGSLRLDAIRNGLEDWELFRALGSPAVPLIKRLVQSPTNWTADPLLLQSIRAEAAKLLAGAKRWGPKTSLGGSKKSWKRPLKDQRLREAAAPSFRKGRKDIFY